MIDGVSYEAARGLRHAELGRAEALAKLASLDGQTGWEVERQREACQRALATFAAGEREIAAAVALLAAIEGSGGGDAG